MTERWGDSARDRQELDNWITREDDEADEVDPDVHPGWWLVAVYDPTRPPQTPVGSILVIAGTCEQAVDHALRFVPKPAVVGAEVLAACATPLPGDPPEGWTYRFLTAADAATIPEPAWAASWVPVWYPK